MLMSQKEEYVERVDGRWLFSQATNNVPSLCKQWQQDQWGRQHE